MEEKNKKDINRRDFIKIVGISAAINNNITTISIIIINPVFMLMPPNLKP